MNQTDTSYRIMGVVNVTPDSFSDGGDYLQTDEAVAHGLSLARDGADILDIGGESTRPGAAPVPMQQEMDRVLPVVEALASQTNAVLSIDTRKSAVAKAAIEAGASIWNDVSALSYDEDSIAVAAALECDIVLMHAQGDPRTMQDNPYYEDVVTEVAAYLAARIELCCAAGIAQHRLITDPGIGFGKAQEHNLSLMAGLQKIAALGPRLLLGASRKRFIAALDDGAPVTDRLGGSLAAAIAGLAGGAQIFRVHDVAATRQALRIAAAIAGAAENS